MVYDYYSPRLQCKAGEWLADIRKYHEHKILQLSVKAFMTAQKYGINHQKTKEDWHEPYMIAALLEYYDYNIEFNPDPLVFYRDLSRFCMYDRFHSEEEKLKISYMIKERGIEYGILTKLPPLKDSIHKIIVNFINK